MEPENRVGILESGRKVDTKWSNPRGYEGSGSRRKPPTTRQSLAKRTVTEVTLESSAPIEERLTWPVRVVLLGGGGHAATSYPDFIPWWSLFAVSVIFLADRVLAIRQKDGWKFLAAVHLSFEMLSNDFSG